ncbi:MAG TPA: glycoside hydrolase family 99-like domain-containing protein [Candidatus Dormibacteraeota bacterium]|nr:glycoside hydrolase family 99-like domain-containing protein [Candidatus Dormibacteraeota bacterium]
MSQAVRLAKRATPRPIKRYAKSARKRLRRKPKLLFNLDSPRSNNVAAKNVLVEGWIIVNKAGQQLEGIRVINGGHKHQAKIKIKRTDVYKSHLDYDKNKALYSGFSVEFELSDSQVIIEANTGDGYKKIRSLTLTASQEKLVTDYFNPRLAENYAEHLNLVDNRKTYYFEKESKGSFKRAAADPRVLAFYLPQFHPIPENDEVWGKGFTEWTNVTAAVPRFIGHEQPVLPADLGYYDLRNEQVMQDQIELAKKYGVFGFCFYYYWFSGKRLLEKPLDSFLKHKDWNFNFAICWANENWTKRWDGRDNEVIVAQQYTEKDPLEFIKDVEDILIDPRYVTEDGKPVLIVYRASELKDPANYAAVWRDYFREKHGRELQLVSVLSFEDQDPREYGFDAGLDFAPQSAFFKQDIFPEGKLPFIDVGKKLIDANFEGTVIDYRAIALNDRLYKVFDFPTYKSVVPSWDNDARKKGKGFVFTGSNPDIYATWLDRVITGESARSKQPLVFVNAWNEWAEGTVLEPSSHLGHSVLKRTAEVMAKHSSNGANARSFPGYGITKQTNRDLAVVVHLYYPERWEYLKTKLDLLKDIGADLFVTINIKDKGFIKEIHEYDPNAQVSVVPNRGRDVLPFVHLARRLNKSGYKYVLKLHTKKSKHRDDGNAWFEGLIDSLLPSADMVTKAVESLKAGTAVIGPAGHFVSLKRYMGSNKQSLKKILSQTASPDAAAQVLRRPQAYGYFAGTMFWVSLDVLRPLLELHLAPEDFEAEEGQIDSTMAHAVERAFSLLPQIKKSAIMSIDGNTIRKVKASDATRNYDFAP